MRQKWVSAAVVFVFLTVISAPLFGMATGLYTTKNTENRVLAEKAPVYDAQGYEAYFNDHFGFRRELVALCSLWKSFAGNRYISDEVLKGKDGYLFYTTDNPDFDPIATYEGTNLYDREKLGVIVENLRGISRELRSRGVRFLVVIPPNKCTVYPEKLPGVVKPSDNGTRLDQIIHALMEDGEVEWIDFRPLFAEKKRTYPLYYKTDTHWNEYGAFFAAQEILSQLGLPNSELADYTVKKSGIPGKDLARMSALSDILQDEEISLVPKEGFLARQTEGALDTDRVGVFYRDIQAPSMMIYRDSFTVAMFPFLAEHFRKSVSNWTFHIRSEDIEAYRPDIVILEILERNIPYLETLRME